MEASAAEKDGSSFSEFLKKPVPTTVSRGTHHLFPAFHPPIPVDSRHHEGQYLYEPRSLHSVHGSYVGPHVEHYLRSVHSSPTLSVISAARGLSPADVTHEHLKDRGLFSLPPLPPGLNPADYHHLMANNQRRPCGDLLMQNGVAAHLPGYISPMDANSWSHQRSQKPREAAGEMVTKEKGLQPPGVLGGKVKTSSR